MTQTVIPIFSSRNTTEIMEKPPRILLEEEICSTITKRKQSFPCEAIHRKLLVVERNLQCI